MKILVYNWRDITHPWAGGAELNIHEQAKRWVQAGHQVTLFCGAYHGCESHATIDGINIIRKGSRFTVYLLAPFYYWLHFRGKYDVIVDIENGIPFFTPLFSRTPKICLAHHVHTEQFKKEFPSLLARIGIFLESVAMPFIYKKIPFITISQSSYKEFTQIGIKPEQCSVIYCGLDHSQYFPGQEKTSYPSLICVGRLMSYKRVDLLIKMMPIILKEIPEAVLHIVGSGPIKSDLQQLTQQLGLEQNLIFHDHISENEKTYLLQRSWVFTIASMKEGWGLVAIEANACGTPVVAYNVPGLREAVANPHSGLLVESEQEFVEATLQILKDAAFREKLIQGGLQHAQKFSWEETAKKTLEILSQLV